MYIRNTGIRKQEGGRKGKWEHYSRKGILG